MTRLTLAALLLAAPLVAQQTPPPSPEAPHDISMVETAPLGGAISVPLPLNMKRKMRRYDMPELAGSHQALGSQLIDGRLPKPLIDFIAVADKVQERISLFEGGLTVVDVTGAGATIRKKLVIPPDALTSYTKGTTANALKKIPQETLVAPADGRRATLRVYDENGEPVERQFDPAAVLVKSMEDQVRPLQDLLRAIYEDRGVTNSVANYAPQPGDELVDDARKVWRVFSVINDKIVVLDCKTEPTRVYVDVHDLGNYFIGKPGVATQ